MIQFLIDYCNILCNFITIFNRVILFQPIQTSHYPIDFRYNIKVHRTQADTTVKAITLTGLIISIVGINDVEA